MSKRLTLIKKELASLKKEKTILLAILIQLFIAGFASFLVVGLVSLQNPGSAQTSMSLEMGVTGSQTETLTSIIEDKKGQEAIKFENRSNAFKSFTNKEIDVLFNVKDGPGGQVNVEVFVPRKGFKTTFIVSQIKETLSLLETHKRIDLKDSLKREPVPLPEKIDSNPYYSFTYTILVPLLAFLPVFISGSIITDSFTEEIETGTLQLLKTSSLSKSAIIDGKTIGILVLAPIQAFIWILLLELNGIKVSNIFLILALVTGFSAIFVSAGAYLGLKIKKRQEAQLLYSMVIIASLATTLVFPSNPLNAVAALAIESHTQTTLLVVALALILGGISYTALQKIGSRLI